MQKPKNPSGTRDFLPGIVDKRNWITDTIVSEFRKFGFEPIETPAVENISTLTGKYGEEGDQLLYRVLNTRDLDKRVSDNLTVEEGIEQLVKMGLRYDLTVPLARFVVQHQHELQFPFRRFQIQPVWRADRAQKGRYREFWQCDADIVGSDSLLNEADLIRIYHSAFTSLGLNDYTLKLNHRGLLEAAAEHLGLGGKRFTRFCVTIDKLDKVGKEAVLVELQELQPQIDRSSLDEVTNSFAFNRGGIKDISDFLGESESGKRGIKDLSAILDWMDPQPNVTLDLSLARGLDYYTGCIFEAIIPDSGMGSISGGGRYDNLTGVFGLKGISGVGISFGVDRLFDILTDRGGFPKDVESNDQLLLCHFDEKGMKYCNQHAAVLRKEGFATLVYPDKKKLKKQLDFANKKNFRWVLLAGDNEINTNTFQLKNLQTGDQHTIQTAQLGSSIKERIGD